MNSEKKLILKCPCCGSTELYNPPNRNVLSYTGFDDCIEWSDFHTTVPDIHEQNWPRSNTIPIQGENRVIKVKFPFVIDSAQKSWSLFQRVVSFFDGWFDYPEEIELSAFVEFDLQKIISNDESSAWIEVEISRVIPLNDICRHIKGDKSNEYLLEAINKIGFSRGFYYKEWIFLNASLEGDVGEWVLLKKIKGQLHLILYAEWGLHRNQVNLGNVLIADESLDKVIKGVKMLHL